MRVIRWYKTCTQNYFLKHYFSVFQTLFLGKKQLCSPINSYTHGNLFSTILSLSKAMKILFYLMFFNYTGTFYLTGLLHGVRSDFLAFVYIFRSELMHNSVFSWFCKEITAEQKLYLHFKNMTNKDHRNSLILPTSTS